MNLNKRDYKAMQCRKIKKIRKKNQKNKNQKKEIKTDLPDGPCIRSGPKTVGFFLGWVRICVSYFETIRSKLPLEMDSTQKRVHIYMNFQK